jgi:hypothetical protein
MSHKKGQSFSFDAIIGSIIFIVAVFSFLSFVLFFQSSEDYRKDTIDKELMRVSTLLMSEDLTYGIMASAETNRIIDTGDVEGKVIAVNGTTPYSMCVSISRTQNSPTYYPSGCDQDMANAKFQSRTARIVMLQDGTIVPLSINIYQK